MNEMFAVASYNVKNQPAFTASGVDTMAYSSAGASAVEELGSAFATAVAYIRAMLERGMSIDEVASQIRFRVSLGSNFFMEIAKIRAARMLWAKSLLNLAETNNRKRLSSVQEQQSTTRLFTTHTSICSAQQLKHSLA